MQLAEVVNFEEARQRIVDLSSKSTSKPFMVGLYGIPDHGKTYFSMWLQKRIYPVRVWFSNGAERLECFEKSDIYIINNPISLPTWKTEISGYDLILKENIGRGHDLLALILNQEMDKVDLQKCRALYGLVIENPASKHKFKPKF